MKVGIDHSKQVLADLSKMAVDAIHLAKNGVGFGSLKQIMDLVSESKDLIVQSKASIIELSDLDSNEFQAIAASCYDLVKNVIAAVAA